MLKVIVGRPQVVRMLCGAMLVGSAALAQQGLVADPWHKAPMPAAALVPTVRALPASGLPPVAAAGPMAGRQAQAAAPGSARKWSPPVVQLLVDPWAKAQVSVPARRLPWLPSDSEIVDPWAGKPSPAEPRVASQQAGIPRSTIF